VDMRTVPRSRSNPQFNADSLPNELAANRIGYARLPALGGFRSRNREVAPPTTHFLENETFKKYADYAMIPAFRQALRELIQLGRRHRVAIMCSEAVGWRCHRRIIADYLLNAGEQVLHILGMGSINPAKMTPAAKPGPHGTLVYPRS